MASWVFCNRKTVVPTPTTMSTAKLISDRRSRILPALRYPLRYFCIIWCWHQWCLEALAPSASTPPTSAFQYQVITETP